MSLKIYILELGKRNSFWPLLYKTMQTRSVFSTFSGKPVGLTKSRCLSALGRSPPISSCAHSLEFLLFLQALILVCASVTFWDTFALPAQIQSSNQTMGKKHSKRRWASKRKHRLLPNIWNIFIPLLFYFSAILFN